jgi:glycyl-tRNA synthetase beta chain
MIISQIKDMLTTLKAAFMIDETLLNEVTHLVEYPIVIKCEVDRKYLNLPQDVIVTSMCEHQRYFPVWDKEQNLMPYFLIVSNTIHDIETIQEGNERVLRARLDDAVFYWDIDSKVLLKDRVEQEKKVIWQEQAGTLWDKTQRIVKISRIIVQHIALEYEEEVVKVAYLSKADLLTEMVGEFPVLQGVMGYYYALAQGEPENIARGIKEHYMPRSAEDSIPETLHGAIVSIADKIDSIVVCFSIGLIPTGSEDPYALRRQAQGIINIILGHKLDINLKWLVTHACNIWKEQQKEEENVDMDIGSIMEFLKQRLEYIFISKGFDVDSVAAVLEVNATSPIDILQRIEALTKIRDMAEIDALGILFKRVINILDTRKGQMYHKLDKTLFIGDAERKLYDAVIDTRQKVDKLLQQTKYFDALYEISTLKDVIDMFFDKVMVMVEDKRLQTNRLALLDNIAELFLRIADLSKLKDI